MADPYEILGIAPGATEDAVRRAFKRAVRRYHPDLHPRDPLAAERLRVVVAAYRQVERMRPQPRVAGAPAQRVVVACQIRGADLFGVLDARHQTAVADWLDVELRALDACGICGGVGYEEVPGGFWRAQRFECEVCRGGGLLRAERNVRVRVPAVAEGTRLRLRGIGLARPGQGRGDAILFVKRST